MKLSRAGGAAQVGRWPRINLSLGDSGTVSPFSSTPLFHRLFSAACKRVLTETGPPNQGRSCGYAPCRECSVGQCSKQGSRFMAC